jgi:hypothetical protein
MSLKAYHQVVLCKDNRMDDFLQGDLGVVAKSADGGRYPLKLTKPKLIALH